MGLDMYLFSTTKGSKTEISYWRKHHDLHGHMEKLYWQKKGREVSELNREEQFDFNCVPLHLSAEDIRGIMEVVKNGSLPHTTGFFFGNNPPNEDSKVNDLKQFEMALREIEFGREVYYDSSW